MKIKEGFLSREVAGSNVVIAVGKAAESFNGMMKLNDTGLFLWKKLEAGADRERLVKEFLETYDVSEERAREGVEGFISELEKIGCIEE